MNSAYSLDSPCNASIYLGMHNLIVVSFIKYIPFLGTPPYLSYCQFTVCIPKIENVVSAILVILIQPGGQLNGLLISKSKKYEPIC